MLKTTDAAEVLFLCVSALSGQKIPPQNRQAFKYR